VRWLQPKYANSIVGRARVEDSQVCFNEGDGCRAGGTAIIAALRWEWLPEGAPPIDELVQVFIPDADASRSGTHFFEVWPSTIRLPQGRTCGGVSLDELPIAIHLQQAEPFYNAPAWGVTSEADIEAIISARQSQRGAPDFTYDQVCSGEGPGTSPPEFWTKPLDAVIP
jgi:hypothetical protein